MAHFTLTRPGGWINGTTVLASELASLDAKSAGAVNGDGGVYAPSSPIQIGGSGLWVTGPCILAGAGFVKTLSGSGARISLGDNDYPVLLAGHTGSFRQIASSMETAMSSTGGTNTDITTASLVTTAVGSEFMTPLRVHNAASLDSVVVTFRVGVSHPGVPTRLPRFRLVRIASDGTVQSLRAPGAGIDAHGWSYYPTPVSGAAWYAANAAQTYTITSDQNKIVDTTNYFYGVEIYDEGDGNVTNALAGNLYHTVIAHLSGIPDLGPQ